MPLLDYSPPYSWTCPRCHEVVENEKFCPICRGAGPKDAATPEPEPKHNGTRPVTLMVIEDLLARDRAGWERYGGPLQAGDGRNGVMDAYQEALDLAQYLRKELAEREEMEQELADLRRDLNACKTWMAEHGR
jgi:hypothetical protein